MGRPPLSNCHNLKHLFTTSIVKSLLQLKKLEISSCSSMEEIMLTEESEEEEEEAERMTKTQLFPKLDTMNLNDLPKLIRICTAWHPIDFQSLRELDINNCPGLMTFVLCCTKRTDRTGSVEAEQVNSNSENQSLFHAMVTIYLSI